MFRQLQLSTGVGLSVRLLAKSKPLWLITVTLLLSIPAFSQINISFDVTEPVCFGLPNGSVTASASGGAAPYTYMWSTGDFGPTINNITAGSYGVTVTDNNGVMATGGIVVGQPDQLLVDLVANICSAPFSVTAFPSGGQGPYGYTWSTGDHTQTINNLPSGTYCVTVTDSQLCGVVDCITLDATPLSVSVVANGVTCPGGMDGQVTATPNGGTPPYTLEWNTGQTGPVLQNLAPGSYTVTVTDANGCMASATGIVSNQPPIVIDLNSTDPTCPGDTNGSIIASASGGTPPFTYNWNTGASGQILSDLGPGTYTVTVTDANGCEEMASRTLATLSNLTIGAFGTSETCPDFDDGFATVTTNNGVPPYTYIWSNGGSTQVLSGLPPGPYSVTVIDNVGCSATASTVVNAAADFEIMVTASMTSTCGVSDGVATANVVTGVGPYTYLWSTGGTTSSISNLGAGTYFVTVTGNNGCQATGSATVVEPPAVAVSINATDLVCAGETNGIAQAIVTGGTPPFTLSWSTGSSDPQLINLPAGSYSVTVTDALGCSDAASAVIQEAPGLIVSVSGTEIVCGAGNTGSAMANVIGGTPPFTYFWSTGSNQASIDGLGNGTYTVVVVDDNGCTGNGEITIQVIDDLMVTITSEDNLCFAQSIGSATANGSGGTPPYSYLWDTGPTTQTISNLPAGIYTVTITDENGCEAEETVIITQASELTVTIDEVDLLCFGASDATLTAIPSGGTPAYAYSWSTGETTQTINNVSAGNYSVTVTDANMCEATASIMVQEAPELVLEIEGTEIVCGAENDGNASVNASGGLPPYTFMWSNGDTEESIDGLGEGTFSVTVTDALGCTAVAEIEIDVIDDFMLNITPRDVLCNGDNTGSILVLPEGGSAPYSYSWSNGENTNEIIGLTAGQYTVTVTDANGCELIETVTVNEPPALTLETSSIDVDCFGNSNGSATVTANGGTPPYSYEWSDNQTESTATDLGPGTYTVTVTDANLCTAMASVIIEEPNELTVNVSAPTIDCAGSSSGTLSPIVVGGTAPYTYEWSTGDITSILENIPAGTYSLTITDANDCTATAESIILEELPQLEISFEVTDIACTDQAVGAIAASVTGGTPPYTFLWSNNATTDAISNLTAGTYFLTVTDANDCVVMGSATVNQFPGLQVIPSSTDVSCPGSTDGTASVVINGGTPPFTYNWSNGADTPQIGNLSPGTYTVTVSGSLGCEGEASVTIGEPSALVLQTSSQDATCAGFSDGQASVTVSGGTPPYSYSWSSGSVTTTATGLAAGTYMVTVTDANGCTEMASVEVGEPTPVQLIVDQLSPTCEGTANGVTTATASGGTPPYTYQWSNGDSGETIVNLAAGTYTVTATDANGCTGTGMVTIEELENPICTVNVVSEVTTFGGSDGVLECLVNGGSGPYIYQWSDGQTGQTANNLTAGTYSVTVTDANGCMTTCENVLNGPARIGDFVWFDIDRDGVQDPGEPGIPGVTVILTGVDEDDPPYTDTTTTDANGIYIFNVPPGTYKVTFINPDGLIPTELNAGADDALDSDADPDMMLMTHIITLGPNEEDLTLDAGFYTKCDNITNPGVIAGNQFLCGPGVDPDPLTNVVSPSGGTGELEYLWMMSTVAGPFDIDVWIPIPNSNSPTYDPGPVFETTYFARCARRECCTTYLESNIVTIEVGSVAVADIQGPSIVCEDDPITFYAVGNGPDAVIEWNFGPGVIPSTATGSPVTVTFTSFGSFEINLMVTENDCTSQEFKNITVTNNPVECGNGLVIDAHITDEDQVMVTWETQVLGDDYSFEVEHSIDGDQFEKIGLVEEPELAIGGMEFYQYLDINPKLGRNYYRVKVVAPTGDYIYSDIAEAVILSDSKLMMVYPNPMVDELVLELFDTFNEEVTLTLVAANGVLLSKQKLPADTKRKVLDVADLPAGVYFLQVTYGKTDIKTLRLMKHQSLEM